MVLFCGGMGMRLREFSDTTPKPLVDVGQRPVLWHLMKYYSHYGHNEFILCLGYGAHKIKEFFLHYDEWATNDFVLADGGREVADARHGHPRLADHVRRHGCRLEHRRAAATGAPVRG